jgi:Uma2 family endonuclease
MDRWQEWTGLDLGAAAAMCAYDPMPPADAARLLRLVNRAVAEGPEWVPWHLARCHLRLGDPQKLIEYISSGSAGAPPPAAQFDLAIALLVQFLGSFVREHDLGIVVGADGVLKLLPQQVRIPDVSFVSWQRLGGRALPAEPIPRLAPDLVVEVISKGNTAEEMNLKLRDYFAAQVRQVWYVYPETKSVFVYKGPQEAVVLSAEATLDGGELLPGFQLSLKQLFAQPQRTSGA